MATKKVEIIPEAAFQAAQVNPFLGTPAPRWIEETLAKPEKNWLLHHAILPGGLTVIGGRPKAGKSFMAYLMAMALASGRQLGPFNPRFGAHTCLYVDREGQDRETALRLRLLALGMGVQESALGRLHISHDPTAVDMRRADMAAFLVEEIRRTGAKAVLVDTMAKTSGDIEENSKKDVQKYLDVQSDVRAATGTAIVLLHHTNKAQFQYKDTMVNMDPDGGLRGSSALAASYDVIFSLQEGWVEGEFMNVMLTSGKYSARAWWKYELGGEQVTDPSTGDDEFVSSWLTFGPKNKGLGFFERAPETRQPKFRNPRDSE